MSYARTQDFGDPFQLAVVLDNLDRYGFGLIQSDHDKSVKSFRDNGRNVRSHFLESLQTVLQHFSKSLERREDQRGMGSVHEVACSLVHHGLRRRSAYLLPLVPVHGTDSLPGYSLL